MPLDKPFVERFQGYFNERRSTAPKFGTSSRNTMLAPNNFGNGFGTIPKNKSNITATDVGPIATNSEVVKHHVAAAVFGTAKRQDLWGVDKPKVVPKSQQKYVPEAKVPSLREVMERARTPPVSSRLDVVRTKSPRCTFGTSSRFCLIGGKDVHASDAQNSHREVVTQINRHVDVSSASTSPQRDGRAALESHSPPGPQSYFVPSEFERTVIDANERRQLMQRYSKEGVHTPRTYHPQGGKGGVISRTERQTMLGVGVVIPNSSELKGTQRTERLQGSNAVPTAVLTPGPGSYTPRYGLI